MDTKRVVRVGSLALAAAISLGLSGCPVCPGAVYFQDPGLELSVRESIGAPLSCLTASVLLQVREVQAENLAIDSLRGIEPCRNVTVLDLSDNALTSITPLTELFNLTNLDLGNNQIREIDALAGLFFLEVLNLEGNPIVDWSPLLANVQNGGFEAGAVVTVGAAQVEDPDGNILPTFQPVLDALVAAGVNVLIVED